MAEDNTQIITRAVAEQPDPAQQSSRIFNVSVRAWIAIFFSFHGVRHVRAFGHVRSGGYRGTV
jgi:hypothetical protein